MSSGGGNSVVKDWTADKIVAERMVHILDEYIKLGSEGDHHAVHMTRMKVLIHQESPDTVAQQWLHAIERCPSSFELRLAHWCQRSLSMRSVASIREEHVKLIRSIENDMKNQHAARLMTENLFLSLGSPAGDDLPLRLREDIAAATIDATLQLILLERQWGNTERAIAIIQVCFLTLMLLFC